MTEVMLREIQPGDLLRVTGTIVPPDVPGTPARPTTDALKVLDAAPLPVVHDLVLKRWGNCTTVFEAGRDTCRCDRRRGVDRRSRLPRRPPFEGA
ncbi:hypothetical protein ACIPRL_36520 [Streptomyces sp. NPDC090085]|uniref:hypothetical protein n=1 Tax=Streptomyces sp. NPDC090085 TaxID=3365943 RepID=UPI0037F149F0